jgi:hypothetical protein
MGFANSEVPMGVKCLKVRSGEILLLQPHMTTIAASNMHA